uniref:Putative P22-like portal protein n=1 Tax=viral metagenome TaxID=1070528 RepID=A0A6M3KX33_9ZZZZ
MASTQGNTSQAGVPQAYRRNKSPEIFIDGTPHPLDTSEKQDRLKILAAYRRQARVAQADNRMQMAIDEDYYDGIQMTPEDLQVMLNRNQPPLVYNITKNMVNFLLGTERKSRIESKVLPRNAAGAQSAKSKTKLIKYTQDVSHGAFEFSQAFAECVKAGLGWMETAVRNNDDEPIFMRQERWRNMWYDHLGASMDGSDWRYIVREKWIDLDIAERLFPDRAERLKVIADNVNSLYPFRPEDVSVADVASEFDLESEMDSLFEGQYDKTRQRLKIVECWYRLPERLKLLRQVDDSVPFGALDGAIYRDDQEDHQYLVKNGYFGTTDALIMAMHCALWTGPLLLQDMLTPYNHNRFPFTPLFCYRFARNNLPYGMIRDIRDPQDDLNKRKSRSLFLLSANRVIMDKGAVDDKIEAYNEVNRPDGMIEVNVGKKFEINKEFQEIAVHNEMARDDQSFVDNISGVTPEAKGQSTRDLSGVAINKLQIQAGTTSGVVFDNMYFAHQKEGEIRLSLIEQFYDQEKEYRITGGFKGKEEFIKVNENKGGVIENSITEAKADFIVSEQDFRETMRMAMFQMLSELVMSLAKAMPEVALALLDEVVDFMDELWNKDELVARIRKINGQHAPEDDMTPEEKKEIAQAEEQMAQKQQMLEQIKQALLELQVANEQANATATNAKAMKDKVDAEMKRLEGFLQALQVAGTIQAAPQLVEAADNLIKEASESGQETVQE